ncbi:MAG: DUF2378 family protein [Hyalangium sp.]|uniref:DUF2378 family protein n=1 Tax=Hyalangium sp. TaxID=2028555 RepID=UPI00389AB3A8
MLVETSREFGREPVVFGHALETLVAEAEVVAPHMLGTLERLELGPSYPLEVAYPCEVWAEALDILVRALSADVGSARAEFLLGQRYGERALRSRIGSAMNAHARVVGPERTLRRTARNLRTNNNFTDATVRALPGGNGWELITRPLPEFATSKWLRMDPPHFLRGVLTRSFEAAWGGAHMELVDHDETRGSSTFHVFF